MTHLIDHRCCDSRPPAALALAFILSGLALAWACLVAAPAAHAQITYAAPIPNGVRIANALSPAQLTLISQFLDAEIANLKSGKPENEKAARKALEEAAASVGASPASATYRTSYATLLDEKLVKLQSENQPLPVRLNAAVTLAHVAARVDNVFLAKAVIGFVLDESEPVALWGVKAGKYVVPRLLETGQAGPLDAAIIKAVGIFRNDAAILEDAYDDFTGDQVAPQTVRALAAIDPLVKLMAMRAALYAAAQTAPAVGDGPDLPAEPEADNRAYSFISLPEVWKFAKPSQQGLMCRAGVDLIGQIIPLMDMTPARAPGVDPPELLRKEDLIAVVNQAGSAFKVIGSLTGQGAGGAIATAADTLTAARVNAQTPLPIIKERLAGLEAALTAARLMAPPMPLPQVPARKVLAPPTPPTAPVRPNTTVPPARPAATPTPGGAARR